MGEINTAALTTAIATASRSSQQQASAEGKQLRQPEPHVQSPTNINKDHKRCHTKLTCTTGTEATTNEHYDEGRLTSSSQNDHINWTGAADVGPSI